MLTIEDALQDAIANPSADTFFNLGQVLQQYGMADLLESMDEADYARTLTKSMVRNCYGRRNPEMREMVQGFLGRLENEGYRPAVCRWLRQFAAKVRADCQLSGTTIGSLNQPVEEVGLQAAKSGRTERTREKGGNSKLDAETTFKFWAIGMETQDKWHLFRRVRDNGKAQWRCQRVVDNLTAKSARIMAAFAESGGFLDKIGLLRACDCNALPKSKSQVKGQVASPLSRLRRIIRDCLELSESNADPIPFDRARNGWVTLFEMGVTGCPLLCNVGN